MRRANNLILAIFLGLGLTGCVGNHSVSGTAGGSGGNARIELLSQNGTSLSITAGSTATISTYFNNPAPSASTLSWQITGSGNDFQAASGTVQISLGDTDETFEISTVPDGVYQGSRDYTLAITGSGDIFTGAISINITVNDNLAPPLGGGGGGGGGGGVPANSAFSWVGGATNQTSGFFTGMTMSGNGANGGLKYPSSSAVDAANGYLYVGDSSAGSINKYNLFTGAFVGAIGGLSFSTGTCPASGPAPGWCTGGTFGSGSGDGMFSGLTGIAIDTTHGFLYAIDAAVYRIDKFNLSTGAFVGSVGYLRSSTGTCPSSGIAPGWCTGGSFMGGSMDGASQSMQSLAVDPVSGYLFVADNVNQEVSRFNLSTGAFAGAIGALSASTGTCPASGAAPGWCTGGTFTSAAGDGEFNAMGPLAVDSSRGFIYVGNGQSIQKFNVATGAFVSVIDVGTIYPGFIAVDSVNGFIYITQSGQVEKLNLSDGSPVGSIGELSSTSGTCPASGPAPGWCTGGTFTTGSGDGMFQEQGGLSVDSMHGYLFVTDPTLYRVDKFNLSSGAFVAALGQPLRATTGWSATTNLFRSSLGSGDGMFGSTPGINVSGIAADTTHGFLYVADTANSRIEKFSLSSGAFVGAIGMLSASTGTCPASGPSTNWCTGGTFDPDQSDGGFANPFSLAVDPINGFLYVSDLRRIIKLNLSDGTFVGSIGDLTASSGTCPASGAAPGWCTGGTFTVGSGDGMFQYGPYIAIDATNGFLYVADSANNRIDKINASSGAFVGSIGKLNASTGTCPSSGAATTWCTGGTFTWALTGDGMFYEISGIAADPTNGFIYVADNSHVAKFNSASGAFVGSIGGLTGSSGTCPSSGAATGWCTGGTFTFSYSDGAFGNFLGVTIDPGNGFLYVSDGNLSKVDKFSLASGSFIGSVGDVTASTGTCPASGSATTWCTGGSFGTGFADGMFGGSTQPMALAADPAGEIYVCDPGNNRVVKTAE